MTRIYLRSACERCGRTYNVLEQPVLASVHISDYILLSGSYACIPLAADSESSMHACRILPANAYFLLYSIRMLSTIYVAAPI